MRRLLFRPDGGGTGGSAADTSNAAGGAAAAGAAGAADNAGGAGGAAAGAPAGDAAAGAAAAGSAGAAAGGAPDAAAAKAAADADAAAAGAAAGAAPKAPIVPEKYDLKLPENAALDATALERTAAHARELGLSNEAAQKVLELANTEAASLRDAFLQSHSAGDPEKGIEPGAAWVQQQEQWKAAAMADKEIGGTPEQFEKHVASANKAFDKFATPEFRQYVWKSGLASHPEVVRVFARIGAAMGEGSVVMPGAQRTGAASTAEILYGGTKKE